MRYEIVELKLQLGYAVDLSNFLRENKFQFFEPHDSGVVSIMHEVDKSIRDKYYVIKYNRKIIAYGLLRGMDRGYEIPTLGIAVDKKFQGKGIGTMFIEFLHSYCKLEGYKKIRIGVMKGNEIAKKLYESLGYIFTEDQPDREYGYKEL